MTTPRFLQIHTLHSYPAALLNRDDSGLAKRMPFGGAVRTRISSQCLKRHWRTAQDDFALNNIDGFTDAKRTRKAISDGVMKHIRNTGATDEVLQAVEEAFHAKLYSGSGSTQPLLVGLPEMEYLRMRAEAICSEHSDDADAAKKAAEDVFHTRRGEGNNMRVMREATQMPAGLIGALFGRMVTSDPAANIDAAVHVAHAFTVHAEESESDYFSVVEDLKDDDEDAGAAHINDTELTAGLFYGYVVVNMPELVSNITACEAADWQNADRALAAKVLEHLTHLIATVSPGAKLGSTAPYACADLMLIEAGSRQPRSLANAFRKPAGAQTDAAIKALCGYLTKLDAAYGTRENRRFMAVEACEIPQAERLNMDDLAGWAAGIVSGGAE